MLRLIADRNKKRHVSECRIHDVFALKLRSFRFFFCGSFLCLFLGDAVLSLEQISDLSEQKLFLCGLGRLGLGCFGSSLFLFAD